jgi:hypothetical protein
MLQLGQRRDQPLANFGGSYRHDLLLIQAILRVEETERCDSESSQDEQ